jgi:hypothetical protein
MMLFFDLAACHLNSLVASATVVAHGASKSAVLLRCSASCRQIRPSQYRIPQLRQGRRVRWRSIFHTTLAKAWHKSMITMGGMQYRGYITHHIVSWSATGLVSFLLPTTVGVDCTGSTLCSLGGVWLRSGFFCLGFLAGAAALFCSASATAAW